MEHNDSTGYLLLGMSVSLLSLLFFARKPGVTMKAALKEMREDTLKDLAVIEGVVIEEVRSDVTAVANAIHELVPERDPDMITASSSGEPSI